MAETEETEPATEVAEEAAEPKKKKGGGKSLLIGLVCMLLFGGGSAYAVMSGLIPLGDDPKAEQADAEGKDKKKDAKKEKVANPKFYELEPITIGLAGKTGGRQLRLKLTLETTETHYALVEEQKDRILDALNTLLRAIEARDLAEPSAIDRVRAQMLRRIRVAIDPNAVTDLLITEYFIF